MTLRIVILSLALLVPIIVAQQSNRLGNDQNAKLINIAGKDELLQHLSAAETFQISNDFVNARIENLAVLGIAFQRLGNAAIEGRKYENAIDLFNRSLIHNDNAANRTNLAIAYLRENQTEKALSEVLRAISIDPEYLGARYILGNIYFNKEEYTLALPHLEKALAGAPDFGIAHALALTYLNLKQLERAKLLFDEIRISVGKESSDLHLLFARDYEKTDYPDEAERELKLAIEIDPRKKKVNFYLGFLLLQNGGGERVDEAGVAFERELQMNPDDFFSLFFRGVVASYGNRPEEAVPYLLKAAKENPESGLAHLYLAKSQLEMEDLAAAEKSLRRAIQLESTDEEGKIQARRTHFLLGRLLLRTGRKEEGVKELALAGRLQQESLDTARSDIDKILRQAGNTSGLKSNESILVGPETEKPLSSERVEQLEKIRVYLTDIVAQAFNNLGVIAVQNRDFESAIESFSDAVEWNEDFPDVRRNLGIVCFRNGDYQKAADSLKLHLSKNQKDELARKMLGTSYYFTNDYSKAVETLKPIEKSLLGDAELAYFYGISLIQLKRIPEAAAVFGRLAEVSQIDANSLFYAAQGFTLLGDYKRTVKEFEAVLAIAPEMQKVNYLLGQSLIRLNRFADAEKAFAREIEVNPGDELSRYHLALTLIERKIEQKRAVDLLEEALTIRYDYPDARYQLGKIYLERGQPEPAIEQLEKAVLQDSSKDYIHYQLSIAYRKVSRTEDADRELKLYQKLKSENRESDLPMPMGANDNSPY